MSQKSFTHDQLDALSATPPGTPVAERHSEGKGDSPELDESIYDRDTEPSMDVQMLRDALWVGLK
ncbi:MAG: hypothetical protein WDO69_17150 [Pseudomonadota bacterium]